MLNLYKFINTCNVRFDPREAEAHQNVNEMRNTRSRG